MFRHSSLIASTIALGLVLATLRHGLFAPPEQVFQPRSSRLEAAPLCPWRQPEADLRKFFPGATGCEADTRVLSGARLELARQLGRPVLPEENALRFYRAYAGASLLGTLLVRRVKGEYGAIEIVVAVDPRGQVQGVRLQRWREPESIADVLQSPAWLQSFNGRTVASRWQLGGAIPDVPTPARASAQAVVEGVRSLLVLLAVADTSGIAVAHAAH